MRVMAFRSFSMHRNVALWSLISGAVTAWAAGCERTPTLSAPSVRPASARSASMPPPSTQSAADQALVDEVRRTLNNHPELSDLSRHATIGCKSRVVTLQGAVKSLEEKDA